MSNYLRLLFSNKRPIFIKFIFLILISKIVCDENNTQVSFYGIYRIDTISKGFTISSGDNNLFLTHLKYLNNHFRIYRSESKPYYFIELRSSNQKLGVDSNNNVVLFNSTDGISLARVKWTIIKLNEEEEVYLIQNKYTRNYLQKSYRQIICMFDYYNTTNKILFKFSLFKMFEEVEFKKEYVDIVEDEPIDVVMKYIDLSDKGLNRTGIHQINKDEDNGELRYSVRSILQYIPWVRKIFIIMPNEKVSYFKPIDEIKEKIVYIKDKDLMGFDCANIYAFIFNFYKLKQFGVTDNFIYMDDDYYIGKEFNKSDFFYYEDKERKVLPSIVSIFFSEFNRDYSYNTYNKLIRKIDKTNAHSSLAWRFSVASTETFLLDLYKDQRLIYTEFTHNAFPMNINDLKEIFQVIQKYKYINQTLYSIERSIYTLLTQYFYGLFNLNIKHRKVHSIPHEYYQIEMLKPEHLKVPLFVVNKGGDIIVGKDKVDETMRLIQQRFPYPTKYEIVNVSNYSSIKFINDNYKGINNNIDKQNYKNQIINENKDFKKIYIQYILILVIIVIMAFLYYFGKNEKLKYTKISNSE
jgi:hypothetical protein